MWLEGAVGCSLADTLNPENWNRKLNPYFGLNGVFRIEKTWTTPEAGKKFGPAGGPRIRLLSKGTQEPRVQ